MPSYLRESRSRRSTLALVAGAMFAGSATRPASADDGLATARDVVERFSQSAIAAIEATEGSPRGREIAFTALLRGSFDLERIASLALGRIWRETEPGGRAAFIEALEAATVATYARRFESYRGERLQFGETTRSGRDVVVATRLQPAFGALIPIDWRLREGPSGWRIIDVVVEGMSMVVTHRAEFAELLARRGDGVGGLVVELNARAQSTLASNS